MRDLFPKLIQAEDPRVQRSHPLVRIESGTILSPDDIDHLNKLRGLEARLEQALKDAEREGQAQGLAQVIDRFADALMHAQEQHYQHIRDARDAITTVAIAAAERILVHTIRNDPQQLLPLIEHVMDSMAPAATITLSLGPNAFALLEPLRDRLMRSTQRSTTLQLRRCPNEPPWAMRFESPHGSVDLGIEQQLSEIARAWGVDPVEGPR